MDSRNGHLPTSNGTRELDILVIGAGFGGIYCLHKLRKLGYNVHVFEAGSYLGGVWYWNTYPGARVDSEMPYYQFSMPEVWRKWHWSERFPSGDELNEYFKHVDETLNLSKDITYNATVIEGSYDEVSGKWTVVTEQGHRVACKYLICATGSSFKPHYPKFRNLSSFKGELIHTTRWPSDADMKDKRVAVIGSGATAIQCCQEISKKAKHLTTYIRTASISLPMVQRSWDILDQDINKSTWKSMFAHCRKTKSGLGYDQPEGSVFDLSDEAREELWEELWNRGGFNFNQANYRDFIKDEKAGKLMYEFWAKKTRPRMKDAKKAAFLVPDEAPFAFGTKRSSLEQDYYECMDQPHVDIVNLKANAIREFTEKGILCEDGEEREFDAIVLATGFDAMTGSLTQMNIHGKDGLDFYERWKNGVFTYLGLCSSGCPNMFMVYGPQAPTAFSNGPVFIEAQVDFLADLLNTLQKEGIKSIEAQPGAEREWKQGIQDDNAKTLMHLTDSWYMGANIPGKVREQLVYLGGIEKYEGECRKVLETLDGFTVEYYPEETME